MSSVTAPIVSVIPEPAMATTVTSKGRVTIPKPVRDRLGIEPAQRSSSTWRRMVVSS